jgi:hypothetical protein
MLNAGVLWGGLTLAAPALALIPDDDDEELVEKAKANRKSRLAVERNSERQFSRAEGFVDKGAKKNLGAVQLTVNALAKIGAALASGSVADAAGAAAGLDVGNLAAAVKALSLTESAASAGETTASELGSLLSALRSGSLEAAKKEYVDSVVALTDWTVKANVSGLKGI